MVPSSFILFTSLRCCPLFVYVHFNPLYLVGAECHLKELNAIHLPLNINSADTQSNNGKGKKIEKRCIRNCYSNQCGDDWILIFLLALCRFLLFRTWQNLLFRADERTMLLVPGFSPPFSIVYGERAVHGSESKSMFHLHGQLDNEKDDDDYDNAKCARDQCDAFNGIQPRCYRQFYIKNWSSSCL